jgi:hypothetical protein
LNNLFMAADIQELKAGISPETGAVSPQETGQVPKVVESNPGSHLIIETPDGTSEEPANASASRLIIEAPTQDGGQKSNGGSSDLLHYGDDGNTEGENSTTGPAIVVRAQTRSEKEVPSVAVDGIENQESVPPNHDSAEQSSAVENETNPESLLRNAIEIHRASIDVGSAIAASVIKTQNRDLMNGLTKGFGELVTEIAKNPTELVNAVSRLQTVSQPAQSALAK